MKPTESQLDAARFICRRPRSYLFGVVGSGKSLPILIAMGHLLSRGEYGIDRGVIVCTAAGLISWRQHINRHKPEGLKFVFYKDSDQFQPGTLTLISYTQLIRLPKLRPPANAFVCLDECHKIKSPTTQTARAVRHFFARAKHLTLATGTRMSVGYIDFYNQYRMLDIPGYPRTKSEFLRRFCHVVNVDYGRGPVREIVGYKNTHPENRESSDPLLIELIEPHTYHYRDKQPMPELKERVISLEVDRDLLRKYNETQRYFERYYQYKAKHLDTRYAVFSFKAEAIQNLIFNSLDYLRKRAIVVYQLTGELKILENVFRDRIRCAVLSGQTSLARKTEIIRNWQAGEYRMLITQIKCAVDSVDLHSGNYMIFTSPVWSLIDYRQMVGRIYRKGQENPCRVDILSLKGGVDENIAKALSVRKEADKKFLEARRILHRERSLQSA